MTIHDEHFTLANGVQIPKVGFGTWQIPDGAPAYDAVTAALAAGYRHIDTARPTATRPASAGRSPTADRARRHLRHQQAAGRDQGLQGSTGELRGDDHRPRHRPHRPLPDPLALALERQGQLQRRQRRGLAGDGGVPGRRAHPQHRGVQLRRQRSRDAFADRADRAGGQPDQVLHRQHPAGGHRLLPGQRHPGRGYSPLATGAILDNPEVRAIADKYGKTVAQLCIRYVLDKSALPLPKTTSASRMSENADLDFQISSEDLTYLDGLQDTAG